MRLPLAAKGGLADRPGAIATRLAEAAGRGVKVEVILEIGREAGAVTQANREAARMLGRRGVKVFVDGSGTTVHAGSSSLTGASSSSGATT